MARKRVESELEGVVDSMVVQLRFQKARRPETWVHWGSFVGAIWLIGTDRYVGVIPLCLASIAIEIALTRRRVGAKSLNETVLKTSPERAIEKTRRKLRKGSFDAEVGPEARAILESCAASYQGIVQAAAKAHFGSGAGHGVMEAFTPLSKAMDALMKEAIFRVQWATTMGRLPDEDALADLRAIDMSLANLRDDARRLARELSAATALPEDLGFPAERAEARRELDQGA